VQADPLPAQAGTADTAYSYVANDPVNKTDPSGQSSYRENHDNGCNVWLRAPKASRRNNSSDPLAAVYDHHNWEADIDFYCGSRIRTIVGLSMHMDLGGVFGAHTTPGCGIFCYDFKDFRVHGHRKVRFVGNGCQDVYGDGSETPYVIYAAGSVLKPGDGMGSGYFSLDHSRTVKKC